jgi:integrase
VTLDSSVPQSPSERQGSNGTSTELLAKLHSGLQAGNGWAESCWFCGFVGAVTCPPGLDIGYWWCPECEAKGLLGAIEAAQSRMAAPVPPGSGKSVTIYAKRWIASREGRLTSVRDDRSRLRDHVLPLVGNLDVATFTRDDVERVVESLDAKIVAGSLNWKTARNVWATFTKLCDDAANAKRRDLRVRRDNPAAGVRAPDRGAPKAKAYLYPSEFSRFVSCVDVPVTWRRNTAIAIYTYMRDGELRELGWEDVDLEHQTILVHHAWDRRAKKSKDTKTGIKRRIPIHPNLLPLLRAMHAESKGEGRVLKMPSERTMARALRRWLRRAGVTRDDLFEERSATLKPIRWHDMRATGITWSIIAGVDPIKVQHRAGHTDPKMTAEYTREAESFAGQAFGEPFPALPLSSLGVPSGGGGSSSGGGGGPVHRALAGSSPVHPASYVDCNRDDLSLTPPRLWRGSVPASGILDRTGGSGATPPEH